MEPFGKSMARAGIGKEGPEFVKRINTKLIERDFIKHLWTQLPPASNQALMSHPEVSRLIFLYRSNLFDVAVSTFLAKSLGHWNRVDPEEIVRPITITPPQIKRFCGELKADVLDQAKRVRASGKPVHLIRYEDLYSVAYRDRFLEVCNFLKLDGGNEAAIERLRPSEKYSGDETLARAIANWRSLEPLRAAPRLTVTLEGLDHT